MVHTATICAHFTWVQEVLEPLSFIFVACSSALSVALLLILFHRHINVALRDTVSVVEGASEALRKNGQKGRSYMLDCRDYW